MDPVEDEASEPPADGTESVGGDTHSEAPSEMVEQ